MKATEKAPVVRSQNSIWRRVAVNLAMVAVSVVVALAAGEAVIRLIGAAPPPGLFTATEQEFVRIPGLFGPNQSVRESVGSRFEHATHIDSLGYRGAEIPRAKPDGELRILYVGDSFTYGHNVGDDETLPAQLEAALKAACGSAAVVNAGVSGTTIAGQDEMIRRGLSLDPDLVILMYHENDVDELAYSRIWEQLAENRRIKSRFPVSIAYNLLRESAIWNLAQDARRSMQYHPPQSAARRGDADDAVAPDTARIGRARDEYASRLARVTSELHDGSVPLLFVLYPHPESVRLRTPGRDVEWIRQTARSLGLPSLDLTEPLLTDGAPLEALFLLPEDYHPSAAGYRVSAQAVASRVKGMLAPSRCPR